MISLIKKLFAAVFSLALAAQAEAACQMHRVATFNVTVENNRIFVPGTINGKAVKFLIATDIESLILPEAAHDMGLFAMVGARLEPIIYTEEIGEVSINSSGPVKVAEMTLGGVVMAKNVVMHVIGRRMNFGQKNEIAVLGRDFLLNYDVEFNLPAGEVILYRSENCEGTNLAYWTERYNVLEMEHHLRVVRVKAKVNGQDVTVDINSGNPYSALSLEAAQKLDVSPRTKGVAEMPPVHDFLADRPIENWLAPFGSLTLDQETAKPVSLRIRKLSIPPPLTRPFRSDWDSETGYAHPELDFVPGGRGDFRNSATTYASSDSRGADLSLGVDFLRSHRTLIAYSQRLVYFSHVDGQPFLVNSP